jgi:Tol biopolymer transport system component
VPVTGSDGSPLNGAVKEAVLSGNGTTAVFTTAASNVFGPPVAIDPASPPAPPVVAAVNLLNGTSRLVSSTVDGTVADGPSGAPSVSGSGLVVAFASTATTLVADDTNGTADVFVRRGSEPVQMVSVATDGGAANAPSSQPSVSADGRFVAFTSFASNLVPDDTNGQADVFLRDLTAGTTRRVSVGDDGTEGDGRSSAPAVNADGSVVAFESAADNLVSGDTNNVADVFVRDLARGHTERVSRSSKGVQQDRGISSPFTSMPDISGDGRYVVFDTEARSLYASDLNRRTDVYLRDRRRGRTTLVSANSFNVQGDNDSVTPRITPSGRFVTFQSFAKNLSQDDGPGPDLFVRDLRSGTTSLIGATQSGAPRAAEPGGVLLQSAPISDDARTALFLSGAPNVATGSPGGTVRLYVRRLTAPAPVRVAGRVVRRRRVVRVRVVATDPHATRLLCRVDRAVPFPCSRTIAIRGRAGKVLVVRDGGPGLLWSAATTIRLTGR